MDGTCLKRAEQPASNDAPQIDLAHELTDGFASRYIRRKARLLVGKARITVSDRPDLEQELALALIERLPQFNPVRAHWNAFVVTIVERQAGKLLRARHRRKRIAGCRALSLSTVTPGPDGRNTELCRLIEPRHRSAVTGHYTSDDIALTDLKIDLATAMQSLSSPTQQLCANLQREPISALARQAGHRTRTMMYQRLARVREVFAQAGFEES